ncbi:DUF4139 domain-containing protein [Virgifigura deserti]|uniref:DUF4139 domain-containing protein n=1 Tax=Virgifigura deserti TaxID=2268457 RepID=UPI003CCBD22F
MRQKGTRARAKIMPRAAAFSAFTLAGFLATGAANAQGPADERQVALEDQTGVSITIYNENLTLVRDRRRVALEDGLNRLAFLGISPQIRPETALLRTDGAELDIVEQSFQADLLTPQRLLEEHVGETVRVIRTDPESGAETVEEGELLSAVGGVVLRIGDRVEVDPPGRIVLPGVPAGLRARPTLVTVVESGSAGQTPVELGYLTGGLGWQADYVAELNGAEDKVDLKGWITLANASGASFRDARVQLVAGEVNQVSRFAARDMMTMSMKAEAAPMPAREALFDYHLYSLDRPVTIAENETKQVALLSGDGVPVRKEYRFAGLNNIYDHAMGEPRRVNATVRLSFENAEAGGLGMPLPQGVVRVYGASGAGELMFVGEDAVEHTPADETVRLTLGRAFDVTARARQTAFEQLGERVYETAFTVELRNAKAEPVSATVVEQIPGDWEVLEESHPHERVSAQQAEWTVPIPANGTTELTYQVRVTY